MFKLNSHILFLPDYNMMEVKIKQNILSNYNKNTTKNAPVFFTQSDFNSCI